MTKEIKGWRAPRDYDYKGIDPLITAVFKSNETEDGWVCPHCGYKEAMREAELGSREALDLIFGYDPIHVHCTSCHKKYYVKCFARFIFTSCEDETFEEGE